MKFELSFAELSKAARPMMRPGHRQLVLTTALFPLPERLVASINTLGKPLGLDDAIIGPIDWEDFDSIRGKGDLLEKHGQQVMLYMRGHYSGTFHQALLDGVRGNKVHVAYCQKLEEMKQAGRLDSDYFLSQTIDDRFLITERHNEAQGYAELKVCKLCLRKLNYEGYLTPGCGKRRIFDDFTYERFFEQYASFFNFHPTNQDKEITAGRSGYTEDWPKISRDLRAKHNYQCTECRVNLSYHRKMLHVHHISGVKNDNRLENLQVLCIDCHSKQPRHQHMFVHRDERQLIASLRQQQAIPASQSWVDVFRLADPGMNGVLHYLQNNGTQIPDVGLGIQNDQETVVATLELAWPRAKLGIAIASEDIDAAHTQGWHVYSVEQALSNPDQLCRTPQ